ncbi:MAG: hypothetical protein PUP92_15255 [Rhizonema sp. PD38]|nr:hypothetical protein [Rhizonema sp. PD38]
MIKYIPTSRNNPCPVCGDTSRRCRHLSDSPDTVLCMTATDAYSAPPGWQFLKLTRDGLWGVVRRDLGDIDEASRREWAERWRSMRIERLRIEKAHHAASLCEGDRDLQIRDILGQLQLCSDHREDLKHRGLNDELITAGLFKSVEQWQKLDLEVSYRLAGVALGGRSLITPQSGYLCPVWNPLGQIVGWQLRVDNVQLEDVPKYLWATSRTRKRPQGATVHLKNGELPLTFCTPANDVHPQAQYIGLAEGILKPWIIAQLRNQITIGAAGGNFAGSPETLNSYLTAAKERLGGTKDVLLWADAGALANKNVMRQYRRTYELVARWGYTLRVAWYGQLDKFCADPDEYTGEYELLTWAQFESLSRNPHRLWDDLRHQLNKIKRLLRPGRGFSRRVRRFFQRSAPQAILVYTPTDLPTPEQYKRLGCPKIIYLGDERVSIWLEAVKKGWQHILDKSAPGLGKSYTAGSMRSEEFGSRQLWYLASDHRNPTTLTVETNFVDLHPRHSGLARDTTRQTPLGQPFLVHPTEKSNFSLTPANCHRAGTFRTLALKNIKHIEESDNPICLSCHLYDACRYGTGAGFGYRFHRHSVLQNEHVRAHPDSLPDPEDYEFSQSGIFWDEASRVMRSRSKIEITISDFNQTVGELSLLSPSKFEKLKPIFELLRLKLWGNNEGDGALCKSDTPPPHATRYGYNDTAIRQLLGAPPDDLADIISQLVVELSPNLEFLAQSADSVDACVGTRAERATSRRINKLLRSTANLEAKLALEAVFLNWLVPLLEVWSGYTSGALQFDKGILSVHQEDTRHRDVASSAQFNIYLDGTLDVRYLALKLGVGVEDVLVIEQVTPQYQNLKVVQITGMGVLGRDRRESMQQRLTALRGEIEKLSPGVAFIERKSYATPGDGYHFRDSRGINRFQDATAVASVGIPYPNIGEFAAEYQVLTGKPVAFDLPQVLDGSCFNGENLPNPNGDASLTLTQSQRAQSNFSEPVDFSHRNPLPHKNEYDGILSASTQLSTDFSVGEDITFQEFVDACVKAEIIQECGRLRAHLRPDKQLVYYFVGDYDLEFLSESLPGITLEKIAAVEISPKAGTSKQQTIWLISHLFSRLFIQDKKPTQQEISQAAKTEDREITQGRVSQLGKEFGGWSVFSRLITELLSSFLEANTQNHVQEDEDERWIKDVYLPLLVHAGEIKPIEAIKEVSQLISTFGWQTFRQILCLTAIDVKAILLEHLLSVIPQDILSIFIDISHVFNEDSS